MCGNTLASDAPATRSRCVCTLPLEEAQIHHPTRCLENHFGGRIRGRDWRIAVAHLGSRGKGNYSSVSISSV